MMCFGNSGASLFFNYSHILLAYKYRSIQRTVPYRLKDQEPPLETKTQRATYYVLMTICFLGPAIQFPASIWYRSTYFNVHKLPEPPEVSSLQTNLLNWGWYLCGISEISSGIILVNSVNNIRKFFIEQNAKNYINLSELMRHATAFGLYMVSAIISYSTHSLSTLNPDNPTFVSIWMMGMLIGCIGSFIA